MRISPEMTKAINEQISYEASPRMHTLQSDHGVRDWI